MSPPPRPVDPIRPTTCISMEVSSFRGLTEFCHNPSSLFGGSGEENIVIQTLSTRTRPGAQRPSIGVAAAARGRGRRDECMEGGGYA